MTEEQRVKNRRANGMILAAMGWLVVPFVMVALRWRRLRRWAKAPAALWGAAALLLWVAGVAGALGAPSRAGAARSSQAAAARLAGQRRRPRALAQTPAQRAQEAATALATLETYRRLGQQVEVAPSIYLTVLNVSTGADWPWPGDPSLGAQLDVEVQLINDSPLAMALDDSQFALNEARGPAQKARVLLPDSAAEAAVTGPYSFPRVVVTPNEVFTGWLIYKVPTPFSRSAIAMRLSIRATVGIMGTHNFTFLN